MWTYGKDYSIHNTLDHFVYAVDLPHSGTGTRLD
jgi:hypothetical protein